MAGHQLVIGGTTGSPQSHRLNQVLVVQHLPHRPYFLPLLKRFQELNDVVSELRMVGLEEQRCEKNRPDTVP